MNTWTISRRVIVGFATMLLIIIALGVFSLWRLTGLTQNLAYLADNALPSILLLEEYRQSVARKSSSVWSGSTNPVRRRAMRNSNNKSRPIEPASTNCRRLTKV